MSRAADQRLPPSLRRRALYLGYANGVLWSIGNGLTTGTVVYYLAMDLGARGLALSFLLALPALVGMLRLAAPAVIGRLGTTRRTSLTMFLAAYVVLLAVPVVTSVSVASFNGALAHVPLVALAVVVALICAHQLLEYLATVALWSWLADLVPQPIRGRYFGRRQILQLAVLIPTLLAGGYVADQFRRAGTEGALVGYSVVIAVGAAFLLMSIVPLAAMPATDRTTQRAAAGQSLFTRLRHAWHDDRFRRLLLFGCWFSFFNGFTQAPQNIYPKAVLGLSLLTLAAMQTTMRLGQMLVSGWAGPVSDRYGNRPVLIVCQLLVASGPLFYLLASPEQSSWLYGAWIVWAAYAGLNICLPNLLLKLSPQRDDSPYIAVYFAVTSLCYAASTVAGGWLFDVTRAWETSGGIFGWGGYEWFFSFGWITRSLGIVWLLRIVEPGAWRWPAIVARRPSSASR